MATTCLSELEKVRNNADVVLALAGNPNVGKSSVFNHLTGLGVVTANYPGKTVEVNVGRTNLDGLSIGIIDLPGTYAIGATSDDQWVTRQIILEGHPDAVIMVVDAMNLARNLYMVLQYIDLGVPLVLALNVIDQAEREGLHTDYERLSKLLGVPVVPTVATTGRGLDEVVRQGVKVAREKALAPWSVYGRDVDEAISRLSEFIFAGVQDMPHGLSTRALAVFLLEEDREFIEIVGSLPHGSAVLAKASEVARMIEDKHGEAAALRMARERHGLAGEITNQVQTVEKQSSSLTQRLWQITTDPITGLPILLAVLGSLFGLLFYVGEIISRFFGVFWAGIVSPPIQAIVAAIFGDGILAKIILWGPDAGIEAALSVGVPYVLTFYVLLAILEDTGYLNAVAFLTDKVMHRIGLHGRAVIPMVAGAGCSVPGVIGTRVLTTMRERMIANVLISMIPCSARTAVILGAVALYVSWQAALFVYLIIFVVVALSGIGLNKVMPGDTVGLVMEMFPFRTPSVKTVLKKTWYRFEDFVFVATPIVLVGSMALGALYETGYIWHLAGPLSPIVEGWLGLPAVAGLALVFAVLRKELALQLLVVLAIVQFGRGADNLLHFMNESQIVTYAIVNTLYIPCLATISVLGRELGWKRTAVIGMITIIIALVVGGLIHRGLYMFGWAW